MTHSPRKTEDSKRRLSILVAAFGTIVEWFDFSVFFYVSVNLARVYFPGQENSLLLTLGVGAAGFFFRPLGAMVFGHLGDRVGRRAALVVSAILMAVAMFGIAITPGYEQIGIWGGVIMISLRCLAGFSVGAEYTGIMVFLMETAKEGRRGLAASWAAANSEVGALLAVGSGALLANLLTPDQMDSWGWRVLFIIGGVLAAVMIPLRKHLEETDTFKKAQDSGVNTGSPLLDVLRRHPKAVIVAFLVSSVGSVSYFLNITYVPTFLETVVEMDGAGSLAFGTIAGVAAIIVTPLIGLASDKFGRRTMFAALSAVLALTTIPAYALLSHANPTTAATAAAFLAVPAAGWSAVAAAAIPEQFTAIGRFSGMAIGFNTATVAFGGLSPIIAASLVQATGWNLAPAGYATALVLAAGIPALLLMRERGHAPLADIDADRGDPPRVSKSGRTVSAN